MNRVTVLLFVTVALLYMAVGLFVLLLIDDINGYGGHDTEKALACILFWPLIVIYIVFVLFIQAFKGLYYIIKELWSDQ